MTFAGQVEAAFTVPSGVQIAATSNAGGPTTVTVTAGAYATLTAFATQFATDLNTQRTVTAGSWTVTLSTGASGTGKVTIAVTAGTESITWTTTAGGIQLRDLLGFTANISGETTSTGANHARGLWLPDSILNVDGDYRDASDETDMRQTESPDGFTITHVGNRKYKHRSLRWPTVPQNKTWIAGQTTTHESLQQFMIDTQWGLGHAWFTAGAKCTIQSHTGTNLGSSRSIAGWYLNGGRSMQDVVSRAAGQWDGIWAVAFPTATTNS